jgi:zinc protease
MPKLAFLENWKAKEVSIPAITGFPIAEPTQILLVHKDNASQSVIMAGHLSMPYDATGDNFKAKITNFSFGGSFNSRLNLNLREDKGYTYGIRAGFSGSKNPGMFYISASVRTNATDSALLEINKELINFVNKGVTDEDVAYTKSSMLNSDALKFETPMDKANFLSRIAEYNLPKDFTTQQNTILKNITKADIDKIAKDFMHPDKMVIVVVGNKYLIKKQLEGLGMGKVKEVTVD